MWKPGMPTSDQWVASTASLPITFAQVREDPRIQRRLIQQLGRQARVLMVAAGGETAAILASLPMESLHLVDASQAQLDLTKLKLAMLADTSTEARLQLLGHYEMQASDRGDELQRRLSQLGIAIEQFGPPDLVAEFGPDFCARNEWLFARLRESLRPHQHAIRHLMSLSHVDPQLQSVAEGTELGRGLENAFRTVMEHSNLVTIFGPDATANRAMPFCQHFVQRTRKAFSQFPACENPFLHQLFLGHFAGPLWDWLDLPQQSKLCSVRCDVADVVEFICSLADQSYDLIDLSTTLDRIKPEQVDALLGHVSRCLTPGGMVLIRQLNSKLDIPSASSSLEWQRDLANELHEDDRSFCYRALHIGTRR